MFKTTSALISIPLLFLIGCTTSAPLLMPTAPGQNVPEREAFQVFVKPIITQGIGSEDEKRLGIDLSAYFTAFEVALVNQTKETLTLSLSNILLTIDANEQRRPLGEAESIRYYKEGDDPSRIVLFPKSKKKVQKEIRKINMLRLSGGDILAGDQKKGLIFFKKVSHNHCRDVVLALEGITVIRSGEKKRFAFPFSCKANQ